MAKNEVKISLTVAEKQAVEALKSIEKQTKVTNQAFSSFVGNIGANLVTGAISKIGSAFAGTFSKIIEEGRNSQKELDDLNHALSNAGIYSEETSQRFVHLADEMERLTGYTGGAVQTNTALVASMTNLNEDGIERTMRAAVELASVYNVDLNRATKYLIDANNGKAQSLKDIGIQYAKTGSTAGDYEQILKQLEEHQGAAAAKANTFEGSLTKSKNAMDAALGAIGTMIVSSPIATKGIELFTSSMLKLAEIAESTGEWIKRNAGLLEVLGVGAGIAGAALVVVAVKAGIASGAFSVLATAAGTAWAVITAPITLIVAGVTVVGAAVYALVKYWDDVRSASYSALAATLEFASKGAAAIGASGKAKMLKEQADAYKAQAEQIKETARAEREAEKSKTEALKSESATRNTIRSEEQIKEEEALNNYTLKLAAQSEDIKAIHSQRLEEMRLNFEERNILEEEQDWINYDAKLQRESEYYALKQQILSEQLQFELDQVNASTVAESDKAKARIQIQNKYQLDSRKLQNDFLKTEKDNLKKQQEFKEKLQEQELSAVASLMGGLSQLAQLGGKKSFNTWKALALSEATIAGVLAVQKALSAAPPPINFIMAAGVGASSAANIGRIAQTQPPAFEQGGIVPGHSYSGDRQLIRANSKEMVLTQGQQARLFNMANGNGSSNIEGLLVQLIQAVKQGTTIEIDGREIVSVVRDGLQQGRAIA